MNRTFVTLPEAKIRLNIALIISAEDLGTFTRVMTAVTASGGDGYAIAMYYDIAGDEDVSALYRALDRLDVLNVEAAMPEGM